MTPALRALRQVDFDWTLHLDSVWQDSESHVPALHRPLRTDVLEELERVRDAPGALSPLGRVIVGPAGAGKTHLLASLRREVGARGHWFVLVDMTDVRDFWDTVILGYLSSLLRPVAAGRLQLHAVLARLLGIVLREADPGRTLRALARTAPPTLGRFTESLFAGLRRRRPLEANALLHQQDVLQALLMLASEDPVLADHAYCWLQGLELDPDVCRRHHFRAARRTPREIVQGLSWVMSQSAPTLLAVDQVDAIVTQHHLASGQGETTDTVEQRASLAIIEGLSGGLMALRDLTRRTLTVLACLESTWDIVRRRTLRSSTDRFRPADALMAVAREEVAREIVERRLAPACAAVGHVPPYPTWPFRPDAFASLTASTPRHILKLCDQHRRACLRAGAVTELHSFEAVAAGVPAPAEGEIEAVERQFESLRRAAEPGILLAEREEDRALCALLQTACRCVLKENDYGDAVDTVLDEDFADARGYRALHARIRWIQRDRSDRERHWCVRGLQRTHPITYQTRLKAAITASGIDRKIRFRQLAVVRRGSTPTGPVSRRVTEDLLARGGRLVVPTDDDLRTLWALHQLERTRPTDFEPWLRRRQPASTTRLVAAMGIPRTAADLALVPAADERPPVDTSPASEGEEAADDAGRAVHPQSAGAPAPPPGGPPPPAGGTASPGPQLPVGRRLSGGEPGEPVSLNLEALRRHTVILAGAASGKTVLVRRLVEEAALLGVPSIVIDAESDLARLGDPWPSPPPGWEDGDAQKAAEYARRAEVVVWTPGREGGNPLRLRPLPDFTEVRDAPEELDQAVDLAREALEPLIVSGGSARAEKKRAVLATALGHVACHAAGPALPDLVAILAGVPKAAGGELADAGPVAREMADQLRAAMATNPLLAEVGAPIDPARLLTASAPGKTRVSVIHFLGLPSLAAQQELVNQLAMTLFTWVHRNPAPAGAPLRGLLVIDEARDFVPAGQDLPCRRSLGRLTAQAQRYGLGLVLATQAPGSVDQAMLATCGNRLFGRASSPAAIEVVREHLRLRGGSGEDVARLPGGSFYLHSEGMGQPVKVRVPMCLSHHPGAGLEATEVLRRAHAGFKLAAAPERSV
jgi:hypothetical protein